MSCSLFRRLIGLQQVHDEDATGHDYQVNSPSKGYATYIEAIIRYLIDWRLGKQISVNLPHKNAQTILDRAYRRLNAGDGDRPLLPPCKECLGPVSPHGRRLASGCVCSTSYTLATSLLLPNCDLAFSTPDVRIAAALT